MNELPAPIKAKQLAELLKSQEEFALLDLREEGIYANSHLLFAISLPLSRVEERIYSLVPRRNTKIILVGEDDLIIPGVDVLQKYGYTRISWLEGGNAEWANAGFQLISGVNVPSKLFGEYVQEKYNTPSIDPLELKELIDKNRDLIIVDSRPAEEFFNVSIPGAVNCPGVELVYRVPELIRSEETMIVVNCAGRTRSIIGSQSLINFGIKNQVVALRNGTIGWHLAGLPLKNGENSLVPPTPKSSFSQLYKLASDLRSRFNVRQLDITELNKFLGQLDQKTSYFLDIRSPQEYAQGHLPEALSAPGGQLVQATDQYIGTRNARVVLIDNDGIRATVTASWLVQMGLREVYLYRAETNEMNSLATPAYAIPPAVHHDETAAITPQELHSQLQNSSIHLIDLSTSLEFRNGHIPGACFAIRSRLPANLRKLPPSTLLVLTSSDSSQAWRSLEEAVKIMACPVKVLKGGTNAWIELGLPLSRGMEPALDLPEDLWYRPTSPHGGGESAMRNYISWEIDLFRKLLGEPGLEFQELDSHN
ncbi:rhodanese-like domain-containing protein [Advenella kashmirensis]